MPDDQRKNKVHFQQRVVKRCAVYRSCISNSENESQKMILAHKFVLAIGSPVFYAMFFGEMAEAKILLNCPTVSTRVCWSCFVICTPMT